MARKFLHDVGKMILTRYISSTRSFSTSAMRKFVVQSRTFPVQSHTSTSTEAYETRSYSSGEDPWYARSKTLSSRSYEIYGSSGI